MFSFKSNLSNSSDEDLMLLVAQGNHKAFEHLYKRYSKNVLYFFYQRLYQNDENAQDFLQDLFIKVIEKAGLYSKERKFKVWLYSMAANMCKNEYRYNAVRGARVSNFNFDELIVDVSAGHLTEPLDRKLFSQLLFSELSKLDETQSMTFELRYINHLSINEISQIMECSEGTVKSRLFYTIRKLAYKLDLFNPYKVEHDGKL